MTLIRACRRAVILGLLAVAGCANPLHEATYQRYISQGNSAERSGDYPVAAEAFRRASLNASWGHLGEDYGAYALWKYGRVLLWMGKHPESEEVLKKALEVREAFEKQNPGRPSDTAPVLAAMSELYLKSNRPIEGMPYVERLADASARSPGQVRAASAKVLREYASRLRPTREADAARLEARASQIDAK